MTIEKSSFTNLILTNDVFVTFGEGNKALICGKGSISAFEIPKFKYVFYVEGLKVNLINISQIYDNQYSVKLTQKECTMCDILGNIMVKGTISKDNFYCIGNPHEVVCNRLSTKELWNQWLGHVNYKLLKKISSFNTIRNLPTITTFLEHVCGLCQLEKQSKIQHLSTMRPLELLYMDLIGSMCSTSIGGRKYILVVVDNFSRYTWVMLLREKP